MRITTAVDQAALSTLRAQLATLRDTRVEVDVDTHRDGLDALRADLASLRNARVRIDVAVDQSALSTLRAQLNALRDVRVEVGVDVDRADLDVLRADLAALTGTRVTAGVDVDRADLNTLRVDLARLSNKSVRVSTQVTGVERINTLRRSIAQLRDKTVRIDVNANMPAGLSAQLDQLARDRTIKLDVELTGAAAAQSALAGLESRTIDVALRISNLGAFTAAVAVATAPRHINVSLDLNNADLARLIAQLTVLQGLGRLGGGAAGGIGAVGSAASSAAGPVALLGAAVLGLGAAAGAGPLVLAGAMGAVSAAAGAMAAAGTLAIAGLMAKAAVMADDGLFDKMVQQTDSIKQHFTEIAERAAPALGRLFDQLHPAFDRLAPSIERVTDGTSRLVDHLAGQLGPIADSVGPMLEKMFNAGLPGLEKAIAGLPRFTDAVGNMFEALGSPEVLQATERVFGGLPGLIEKAGAAAAGTAGAFNDLMGWLDAGNIDGFTEGWSTMVDSITGADWSGTVDSIAALANSFGSVMESVDGQALADNLDNMARAASGVNEAFAAAVTGVSGFFDSIGATDATTALAQDLGEIGEELEMLRNFFDGRGYKLDEEIAAEIKIVPTFQMDSGEFAKFLAGQPFDATKVQPNVEVSPVFGGISPDDFSNYVRGAVGNQKFDVPINPVPAGTGEDFASQLLGALTGQTVEVPVVPQPGFADELFAALTGQQVEVGLVPKEDTLGALIEGLSGKQVEVGVTPAPGSVESLLDGLAGQQVEVDVVPREQKIHGMFGGAGGSSIDPVEVPIVYGDPPAFPAIPVPPPVPVTIDVSQAIAAIGQMASAGQQAGAAFAVGVAVSAGAVAAAAGSLAAAAVAGVGSVNLAPQGAAAGQSFAAGLRSASGSVAAAARSLGDTARANKGHYRGLRGLAADRVMLVENGQAMVAGFVAGMHSQRAQLITAAAQLATDVQGEFHRDVMPRIGVAGRALFEQNVQVAVTAGVGGDPVDSGRVIQSMLSAYAQAVGQSGAVTVDV